MEQQHNNGGGYGSCRRCKEAGCHVSSNSSSVTTGSGTLRSRLSGHHGLLGFPHIDQRVERQTNALCTVIFNTADVIVCRSDGTEDIIHNISALILND